jgi:hypothetical protein
MSSRSVWRIFEIAIRASTATSAAAFLIWMGMTGCAPQIPSVVPAPASVEKALFGKTKQDLLACSSVIPNERKVGDVTELMFYKEASLLEESFPVSKSNFATVHHGCLAHVQLKEGHVQSIHYHAVPPSYPDYDHCDDIFAACSGH